MLHISPARRGIIKSQVALLQTAHYWANAGVLVGGRMSRGSCRNKLSDEVRERNVIVINVLVSHVRYDVVVT